MIEMYLTEDIIGPFSLKEYGLFGDEVNIIAVHGDIVIVEGSKERFPVKIESLSENPLPMIKAEKKVETHEPVRSKGKGTRTKTVNKSLF